MTTSRLEAFSDGVVAILITIMVLELPVPHGTGWSALDAEVRAKFAAYVLSFVFLGIYWANHHHMLHMTHRVNGKILWANLHLLFWLSLVPFATAWMGPNHLAAVPTAVYGIILLAAAVAYTMLQTAIIADQGPESKLKAAVQGDWKGKLSLALYAVAIGAAFVNPWISDALYAAVALMWLVPDPRIESRLRS
jgi:TMEM175 potassium channel family protein